MTAFVGEDLRPERVDLLLEGDRIGRILPSGDPASELGPSSIDGSGLLAFPGMIDCHDHLRNLTPGLAISEGRGLDDFLKSMWESQRYMGRDEYRVSALLGSVQRLKTGITTVCDHCYTFHTEGLDEASIAGYEASGCRWMYARGIMTRPYEPVCESWGLAEARIRSLVDSGAVSPQRLFVAPVSIRQATPAEYRDSRALADDLGCGLYTHVAETAGEIEMWWRECGQGPIQALDDLGFLTERTVLVHCVVLDDADIDLIAERGCHVVHCPTNNMKLAKGVTRVPDLLAAGINVALGVDMMSDLLSEMRAELNMHSVHRGDPNAVGKLQAMRMATLGGAHALGVGDSLGCLAEGREADVVLLDARNLLQAVMVDPVYALLYASHAGMVHHVVLGGRLVVENGRCLTVNEDDLVDEAEGIAESYLRRLGVDARPWFAGGGSRRRAEREGTL